jgi:hypothetical protein
MFEVDSGGMDVFFLPNVCQKTDRIPTGDRKYSVYSKFENFNFRNPIFDIHIRYIYTSDGRIYVTSQVGH